MQQRGRDFNGVRTCSNYTASDACRLRLKRARVARFDFAQYGKIRKVTVLYVLQDDARQSCTEDLKVRRYYRPL